MTNDWKLLKELVETVISKFKIRNREHLTLEGKRIIAIEEKLGLNLISYILLVLETYHNLLIVSQLLNKGYKV